MAKSKRTTSGLPVIIFQDPDRLYHWVASLITTASACSIVLCPYLHGRLDDLLDNILS